jgi:hypothetical protein
MAEFDSAALVFRSRPKHLAALMTTGGERDRLWRPEELAAIFRHQMSAPVLVDLGGFDAGTAARLNILSEAQGLLLKSFSELFRHPAPPLELLERTKDFAKLNLDHSESGLPSEIAGMLYYLSIATALVSLDRRISQLSEADLRRGLLWARDQGWIDDTARGMLVKALARLAPETGPGSPPP